MPNISLDYKEAKALAEKVAAEFKALAKDLHDDKHLTVPAAMVRFRNTWDQMLGTMYKFSDKKQIAEIKSKINEGLVSLMSAFQSRGVVASAAALQEMKSAQEQHEISLADPGRAKPKV
jgi:hypothetical protein